MEELYENTAEQLQNEDIYHALFDNRREAILIASPDGQILRANMAACQLFGYTEAEFLAMGTYGTLNKADARAEKAVKERQRTGHFQGEIDCVRKNGEVFPTEISSTTFRLADGRPHYLTIINDISEKKKVERDMELLLSNTQESFLVIDKDLRIITFNDQFNAIYREQLGRDVQKGELIMSYDMPAKENLEQIAAQVLNGNKYEREVMFYNTEGKVQYFSMDFRPAYEKSGNIIGIFISSVDITQRRNANAKILLDKERYDLAAKATNDAIYDWDIVNNTMYWGEGVTTLFGYSADDDIHTIESWIRYIHPEDLYNTVYSMRNAVYSTTELQWQAEYRYLKSNGQYAVILDRGFIIRSKSGKATRMIGAMQDITLRKQTESTLKQLNEQMKRRAEELAASNEELEQFAYIASHDLQEPLRMVTSFLTQLEKKYKDQLDDKAQKYIWFAVDGAVRMRQIIFDLLDYSRMARADYVAEPVDTAKVIKGILHLHSNLIGEQNAAVLWEELPVIKASRVPLEHVFNNLISNALKYHRPGVPPVIRISVLEKEDCWQFAVADNGIGIRTEFYQKIFVIFQRLHNKEEYSGTGIGLAICKKIVELHKGKIWVESEPEKGSTFYFTICK